MIRDLIDDACALGSLGLFFSTVSLWLTLATA
jgi:hypothetical protein